MAERQAPRGVWKGLTVLVTGTLHAWSEDNVSRMAAALAFYTTFSVAPALLIGLGVAAAFVGDGAAKSELLKQIGELVSPQVAEYIFSAVNTFWDQLTARELPAVGVITGVVAATAMFAELQSSLNSIWHVHEARRSGILNLIRQRAVSFVLIVGLGVLILASVVTSTVLSTIDSFFADIFRDDNVMVHSLNWCISGAMIPALLALAYKIIPDTHIAWRDVLPGAAATTLLFILGKRVFGMYLGMSSVISIYGAAGSFVILLIWVYYSAQVFFLGAEMTKVYAMKFGSRSPAITSSQEGVKHVQSAD